jgi:hypothetical protein
VNLSTTPLEDRNMSKRAERRHHLRRMKAKAERVYPDWERAARWADHLHGCSCHMCRNPRHSHFAKGDAKFTPQEVAARRKFQEGVRDLS